jgi:hypothetical protein
MSALSQEQMHRDNKQRKERQKLRKGNKAIRTEINIFIKLLQLRNFGTHFENNLPSKA